jgi:hypothetical protein
MSVPFAGEEFPARRITPTDEERRLARALYTAFRRGAGDWMVDGDPESIDLDLGVVIDGEFNLLLVARHIIELITPKG